MDSGVTVGGRGAGGRGEAIGMHDARCEMMHMGILVSFGGVVVVVVVADV